MHSCRLKNVISLDVKTSCTSVPRRSARSVQSCSFCLDVKTSKLAITVEKTEKTSKLAFTIVENTPAAPTEIGKGSDLDSHCDDGGFENIPDSDTPQTTLTVWKMGITSFIPVRIAQNFSLVFTSTRRRSSQSPRRIQQGTNFARLASNNAPKVSNLMMASLTPFSSCPF